ncbi:SAM-dependent methyltransferase, partial [Prochlorothrix hollandica]|uniref:SAM-dependent methyltransferase n=1 Tax=Prochlorothrix hollandica TaxID=1223 RepID=UPI00333E5FB6
MPSAFPETPATGNSDQETGTLYGISAGPGDPDLITVKGLRLLQHSPVVAFPAGRGDRPG